jgi:hypothetical protein
MLNTTTIITIITIIIVAFLAYIIYNRSSIFEKFEENITIIQSGLNDVDILPECVNMTPVTLYKLLGDDIDRFTQIMIDNGIPDAALKSRGYYPKIASFLITKGIIKSCNV